MENYLWDKKYGIPENIVKMIRYGTVDDVRVGIELVEHMYPGFWKSNLRTDPSISYCKFEEIQSQTVRDYRYKIGDIEIIIGSMGLWRL